MKMPLVFVGHGSPMNAIEDNVFSQKWRALGKALPRPKAILAVSAHWFTQGLKITDATSPKTVYDMYGFPEELYQVTYNAPGAPELAHKVKNLLGGAVKIDNSWGIDHGAWSVLHHMYPAADIPTFQLSVDRDASPESYFETGQRLYDLRKEGVLIFGSGNVVHNLARVNWNMEGGYPFAQEFDEYIKFAVLERNYDDVIHFERAGASSEMSFYMVDHFAPLLYILGATDDADKVSVFNNACTLGALSMTGYLFE